MAFKYTNAEGGTNGNTIVLGDTGSGTPTSVVTITGTGTYTYANASACHGSRGYLMTSGTTGTAIQGWTGDNGTSAATRAYLRVNVAPNLTFDAMSVRSTSGGTAKYQCNANRTLFLQNASGSIIMTTSAMTLGVWYRLEIQTVKGADTSTGTINAQFYLGDSSVALNTYSSTTTNSGTNNYVGLLCGKITATPTANVSWDSMAVNVGTSTPIGAAHPGAMF